MNRTLFGVGALAAGLVLSACGGGSQAAAGTTGAQTPPAAPASPSATAVSAPAETAGTSPAGQPRTKSAPAATAPSPSDAAFPLILQPDGLGYVINESTIRQLSFGNDAAQARELVSRALGGPLERRVLECPQGTRTWYERDNFTILVDGKKFVGWLDGGSEERTWTTLDGAGVGSSLARMKESVSGISSERFPPYGYVFFTDDGMFGGELDGKGGNVTRLYGGEECIYH